VLYSTRVVTYWSFLLFPTYQAKEAIPYILKHTLCNHYCMYLHIIYTFLGILRPKEGIEQELDIFLFLFLKKSRGSDGAVGGGDGGGGGTTGPETSPPTFPGWPRLSLGHTTGLSA